MYIEINILRLILIFIELSLKDSRLRVMEESLLQKLFEIDINKQLTESLNEEREQCQIFSDDEFATIVNSEKKQKNRQRHIVEFQQAEVHLNEINRAVSEEEGVVKKIAAEFPQVKPNLNPHQIIASKNGANAANNKF